MFDEKNRQWTCPETGTVFDLSHLKDFVVNFGVKLDKQSPVMEIPCLVEFNNHCFTRTRGPNDPDNLVFCEEKKKGGVIEQRVFCPERWDFSLQLPEILRQLGYKYCLEGGGKEILYRQEDKPRQDSHEGWYICMRLDYRRNRDPNLMLRVRSSHRRANRPVDVRSGPKRFPMLLAQYLKKRI